MAYRLEPGESVREGLPRIAREELARAGAGLLEATAGGRDGAIHEARKSVKKVRAILRLMRGELGRTFGIENRRLREVGRRLSVYRDGAVMIETLDRLAGFRPDERNAAELAGIRRDLAANQRRQRLGDGMTAAMSRAAGELLAVEARIGRWRLVMDGPVALAPGIETAYRGGRARLADARRHARPEYCHEWRKRVKDHWYHLRLLESRWNPVMRARERSLKELETCLGEHHNLEVLAARLEADRRKPREADRCRKSIGAMQRELRAKAIKLGERLYGEPPEAFAKRVAELWRARGPGRGQKPAAG
jgi:CHAD domain-containing protein